MISSNIVITSVVLCLPASEQKLQKQKHDKFHDFFPPYAGHLQPKSFLFIFATGSSNQNTMPSMMLLLDTVKCSFYLNDFFSMWYKDILLQPVWISLKVWANRFIGAVAYIAIVVRLHKPLICLCVLYFDPVGPMSCDWVWFTALDCIFRNLTSWFCVESFVECAADDGAARPINFHRCCCLVQDIFHSRCYFSSQVKFSWTCNIVGIFFIQHILSLIF